MASKSAANASKNVYRGYMPIDLPQHKPKNPYKWWWRVIGKPRVTIYPKEEVTGFSETAEYPPLNCGGSRQAQKKQFRLDWYKKIESIPTVEEKNYEILHRSRHKMIMLNNWINGYNTVPLVQTITQTHVINSLPDYYQQTRKDADESNETRSNSFDPLVDIMSKAVLGQVALDKHESVKTRPAFVSRPIRDDNREGHVSSYFIANMFSNIKKTAATVNQQLMDYQVDWRPAIRSWVYHSGFSPQNNKTIHGYNEDENGKINLMLQIDGSSAVNMRAQGFIEPYLDLKDPLVTNLSLVPQIDTSLMNYGSRYVFKWPVSLPGFWQGEENKDLEFPHTCFLTTDCLKIVPHRRPQPENMDDTEQMLNGQAILTAYSWLSSLATYHGFTPFHNTNYPFTCQVITTDGQNWLFNVYQMNNNVFHRDLGGAKLNNILWTSGVMQLYSDYSDGSFKDVNEEVIRILLKFMSKQTNQVYTNSLDLRPHLGEDQRTDETKAMQNNYVRRRFEQRHSRVISKLWQVPLFEHIFFRSKEGRRRITHMKPKYHHPLPTKPPHFD